MIAVPRWATVAIDSLGRDEMILLESEERSPVDLLKENPDEIIFGIENLLKFIWENVLLILEVITSSFRIWVVFLPSPFKHIAKGCDGSYISTNPLTPGEVLIAIEGNVLFLNEATCAATSPRPVLYSTSAVCEAIWEEEIEFDI